MPLKIQLNLQALERLIGGDSEVEVELRTGVVQEFTRRHLKGIVTNTLVAAAEQSAREATHEALREIFTYDPRRFSYKLPDSLKADIEKGVRDTIDSQTRTIVRETEISVLEEVKKRVSGISDNVLAVVTEKEFEARVTNEVNRRLKAAAEV